MGVFVKKGGFSEKVVKVVKMHKLRGGKNGGFGKGGENPGNSGGHFQKCRAYGRLLGKVQNYDGPRRNGYYLETPFFGGSGAATGVKNPVFGRYPPFSPKSPISDLPPVFTPFRSPPIYV
jgi:hypothetical protein